MGIGRINCILICLMIIIEAIEGTGIDLCIFATIEANCQSMSARNTGKLPTPASTSLCKKIHDIIARGFGGKDFITISIYCDDMITSSIVHKQRLNVFCNFEDKYTRDVDFFFMAVTEPFHELVTNLFEHSKN